MYISAPVPRFLDSVGADQHLHDGIVFPANTLSSEDFRTARWQDFLHFLGVSSDHVAH
jgi:hypothetical protein